MFCFKQISIYCKYENRLSIAAASIQQAAFILPVVIGSIMSWLLSATSKAVNWSGNNLWALVVFVAGLLYAAAKE